MDDKEQVEELEKLKEKIKNDPELAKIQEAQQKQIELTKEILNRVKENRHSEFQFIHNLLELHAVRVCIKAQTQLVKNFRRTARTCMINYLSYVENDEDNIKLLLSYKEIKQCIDFYLAELAILKDMIKEYRCYVRWGHILKTLVGINRPDEDCVDWRTIPIQWNPFKK